MAAEIFWAGFGWTGAGQASGGSEQNLEQEKSFEWASGEQELKSEKSQELKLEKSFEQVSIGRWKSL